MADMPHMGKPAANKRVNGLEIDAFSPIHLIRKKEINTTEMITKTPLKLPISKISEKVSRNPINATPIFNNWLEAKLKDGFAHELSRPMLARNIPHKRATTGGERESFRIPKRITCLAKMLTPTTSNNP
jgi:hypothetical protein